MRTSSSGQGQGQGVNGVNPMQQAPAPAPAQGQLLQQTQIQQIKNNKISNNKIANNKITKNVKKNNKNIKKNNNTNTNTNTNTNNAPLNEAEMVEQNISSYKTILFTLLLIVILSIIGYFVSFSYRESRGLKQVSLIKDFLFIDSKVNTRENRNKKLCDFYISAAYRPYMVINQRFDYCSLEVLKSVLVNGVRCVYLDVFNSTINENAYPIVTSGIKQGEWKLGLNSLLFEDVCILISSIVFSNGYVNNFRDPFILCLNLNTNNNVVCLNKIKKILYRTFKSKLLSNDYTFGRKNIAEVPVYKFLDKVLIFTSDGYKNSELEEMVNFSWDRDELNKISYKSLDPDVPDNEAVKYNLSNLTDYNKNNITMVMPDEDTWFTYNYDVKYALSGGCQLNFVNYNKADPHLDSYITKFKNDSFLPKPVRMISVTNNEVVNMNKIVVETSERDEETKLNCPEDAGINIQ